VIWYYTFGVNCSRGFSRSHTHLFHFVVNPREFTFNADNPMVRVPSARQLVYADSRANPRGRLPDNTWIIRPQDAPESFRPEHDTWYFPRVAGTFKEREGFHGCQMPEQLLGRIVRISSNPGDLVLDPFAGSGTTLSVSKKLGRRWIGFELSREYAANGRKRVANVDRHDELTGPEDPLKSAPSTRRGKKKKSPAASPDIEKQVLRAYRKEIDGHSADHLLCDPELNARFVAACRDQQIAGSEFSWNRLILKLRKSGRLPKAKRARARIPFEQMDPYRFASEIATRLLSSDLGLSLEDVFCTPRHAAEFDRVAARFAPGFSPFQYRWAALAIRKRAKQARTLATSRLSGWRQKRLPPRRPLEKCLSDRYAEPGVYLLFAEQEPLYVGETENVSHRIEHVLENHHWRELQPSSVVVIRGDQPDRMALQSAMIGRIDPLLNSPLLHPQSGATSV
jgi:site-specific DNA-methyltransferase (adenine-specific)